MSSLGPKIIAAVREAIDGDLARVTIEGQTWMRADDLLADQREIMRINNELRDFLLQTQATIARLVK